jgi:hypothetical protein
MWKEDLKEFDPSSVESAFKKYRTENKFMPMPSDLIKILKPQRNKEDHANYITALVIEAIKDFGYADPERARRHIGESGWHAVNCYGGWEYVCQHVGTNKLPIGMFRAQFRDSVKSDHDHQTNRALLDQVKMKELE